MKRLVMACLILGGCGLIAGPALGEDKPKAEKVFEATVGSDGVQHVDILGGSYFFTPTRVIVKVNVPVELNVKKESGIVPHNIVMKSPEAGIDFNVSMGNERKVIRFIPTRTGTYPFYCDKKLLVFESHRDKGMKGVLEVVE